MSVRFPFQAMALVIVALALQAAGPAPSKIPLGRANPFKPLIGDAPGTPSSAPVELPPAPIGNTAPELPPPVPVPTPVPDPPKFVAIAWDAEDGQAVGAVAALRVDGKTRFVRVGDTVGRDRVVAITREAVTLRSTARTLILPLAKR